MKKTTAIFMTISLLSVQSFALSARDVCNSIWSPYERLNCFNSTDGARFDNDALEVCRKVYSDSEKTTCLQVIKDKSYGGAAVAACDYFWLDNTKMVCLNELANRKINAEDAEICLGLFLPDLQIACLSGASSAVGNRNNQHQEERNQATGAGRNCAERVRDNCSLSNREFNLIADNVAQCKQFTSGSGKTKLEVLLMDRSGKVIAVNYSNKNSGSCQATKYRIDGSGIEELKVLENLLFMRSADGQVYFMFADGSVHELMNSSGKSYSTVRDISGANSGKAITLKMKNGDAVTLDKEDIQRRKSKQIDFVNTYTFESLFSDYN